MKKILTVIFSLFFILYFGNNYSLGEDLAGKENRITLYKGEIKSIAVDNPTRVIINNPAVADVTSVSKSEMLVSAKEPGETSLVWRDAKGMHTSQVQVFIENMSPIKERIDKILKEMDMAGVVTRNMDSEGTVLLLGNVKTAQDLERINVALNSFKGKIVNLIQLKEEETVIGIDVQVLELDKDATNTLGLSWPGSTTITEVGSPGIQTVGTVWDKLFKVSNVSRAAFTLTLDALVQEGKARVLSQPRLSCQSGKEAELLVGGEVPILSTSVAATTGATGTNVDYKEYGIKLKIKPVASEDKKIKLALAVEVSEVNTATPTTLGSSSSPTALAYPLTKRNASTELFLKDGQTMAIGGLKKQKESEDIRKTPFLGNVPILGLLFRKRTTMTGGGQGQRGDIDLYITLTPTIVKESAKKEETKLSEPPAKEEKPAVKKEEPAAKKEKPIAKEEKPAVKEKEKPAAKEPSEKVKTKPEAAPSAKERAAKIESKLASPYPQIKQSPITEYVWKVSQQIRRNFVYPWAAKEADIEGSLRLALHVYYTGQLLGVEVKQTSGYAVLDEHAVNMVREIAPYPPFPPEMKQKELWIDLPVVYKTK